MNRLFVTKKNLNKLLDKPVFNSIAEQSMHHGSLFDVAIRATELVGNHIMTGKTRLIDYILCEAMTSWHATLYQQGVEAAYQEYCNSIFNALSELFDFTVTGNSSIIPFYHHTWDCLSFSFYQWVLEYKIDLATLTIKHTPSQHSLDKRNASYILSSRVFNRHDMCGIGLASEIHSVVGR
jgi:hypothetical protein